MADKQIIIDGVDVSGCCQYMPRYMEDYDIDTLDYCRYHFKPCKDVDVKNCYYKQLKQSEQNAQDTYDMFKACMQSLEIARKQLSDEQQKVYQICKICEKYSVNYVTNTGLQLMVNEITDIIGDKTNE